MGKWNVQDFVVAQMVREFGYELIVEEDLTYFRRVLDGQHASIVSATMKPSMVSVYFAMARRDINELRDELLGPGITSFQEAPWAPVYHPASSPPFDAMPRGSWLSGVQTQKDVAQWLGLWVPKLESVANLSYVQRGLELVNPRANEQRRALQRQRTLQRRMANRMLWGWRGERDDEEFLVPLVEREQVIPPGDLKRAAGEMLERTRAWIADHPDGIERELVGDAVADFEDS